MMRKLIVVTILIAVLCTTASARTPQIGDKVLIGANAGSYYVPTSQRMAIKLDRSA